MAKHLKLEDILLQLRSDSDTQKVTVGELVSTFEQREFGPLLIVPALLTLLPTGAIP
ncbi:MAG: exopolysaccharide biosynthesis protein, partial [Candidatus Competibacteraceae bacterium]|nr:exopolysaccharide biosynthesis protein [Candidatus Competibacteraceae bacterium]